MTRAVREAIREPVRRSLRWMASLRDAQGRIICPEHKVEHTGKNVGAIVSACALLKHDAGRDSEWLFELALGQARRACDNLVREGTSECHTFRPGRHDPFNCSNSVIDGGACSDALATFVTDFGERLVPAERERFRAASLLHARTYLRYAVLDKGIPAQRAWGLTGLAGAFALEPDPTLADAAIEAVGVLEGIQNADGSYPYHPVEWGGGHPGSGDVSSFYQSRVSGFLMFALERMGRDPRDRLFAAPLVRGLDFLCALQGPDGIKCGLLEAKPWYWGANYEVASHAFDVHALAHGWRLFRRARYGIAAKRAYTAWIAHLGADGEPRSHTPGPGRSKSYQCPLFWAGHAMWIARAFGELEELWDGADEPAMSSTSIELAVTWFPNAKLARLEDSAVVAWVRGARPPANVHHGSPHGAGLIRVFGKHAGTELVERCRFSADNEGEWSARHGFPSPTRGWRTNGAELRFALWLARVAWRGGRHLEALRTPARVLRRGPLAFAATSASSAFDLQPTHSVAGDGIRLTSCLAHRDGTPIAGSRIERSFTLDGQGLVVEERMLDAGGARAVDYRIPSAARGIERTADRITYRLG